MKAKIKENDLVLVDWDDSCGSGRWENREDAYRRAEEASGMPCRSVGWVLRSTSKCLTINGSHSKHSVSDQTSIPWVCVTKIRHLTPKGGK